VDSRETAEMLQKKWQSSALGVAKGLKKGCSRVGGRDLESEQREMKDLLR